MIKELETLVRVANTLDSKGEYELSALIDVLVKKAIVFSFL